MTGDVMGDPGDKLDPSSAGGTPELMGLLAEMPLPVFARDPKGRITFWNRGAADTYGWSSQEAVGQMSDELLHTVLPAPLGRILDTLTQTGNWQGRLVHTTRQGRQATVDSRWSRAAGAGDDNVLVMENEVTEQAAALALLREKEHTCHTLSAVLDLLPGYAALMDADHRILFASRGFSQTFSPPQGRRCYQVRFALDRPCEDCPPMRVLATQRAEDWEETLPDGRS
jgi:PAS domain S-box-containing protein